MVWTEKELKFRPKLATLGERHELLHFCFQTYYSAWRHGSCFGNRELLKHVFQKVVNWKLETLFEVRENLQFASWHSLKIRDSDSEQESPPQRTP